jgi:hypothetical protein
MLSRGYRQQGIALFLIKQGDCFCRFTSKKNFAPKGRFRRGKRMASKEDGERSGPAKKNDVHPDETRRSYEQIEAEIADGTYRIDLKMIAVTLARLLKEQKSMNGSHLFPSSSH